MRAQPRDDLLEENLHPAIVGTLEQHLSRTSELVVMVPGFDGPRLSVYLRDGRIDWIGWLQ